MNRTITHFAIYHHTSYSFHLIYLLPIGLVLTRKVHVYWACVSTTQIHDLTLSPALPPLLQPRCTFQSSSWILGALRVLRICHLDEVEEIDE
jgi:hypothetical protein